MTSVQFCYWLQGMFEIAELDSLNYKQTELIKQHLNMVFIHEIDPSYPSGQQEALNQAHNSSDKNTPFHTDPKMRC
jgi:hypothetical protein